MTNFKIEIMIDERDQLVALPIVDRQDMIFGPVTIGNQFSCCHSGYGRDYLDGCKRGKQVQKHKYFWPFILLVKRVYHDVDIEFLPRPSLTESMLDLLKYMARGVRYGSILSFSIEGLNNAGFSKATIGALIRRRIIEKTYKGNYKLVCQNLYFTDKHNETALGIMGIRRI